MPTRNILAACASLTAILIAATAVHTTHRVQAQSKTYSPEYTKSGELIAPTNYRQWIFLTSGFDMTYRERKGAPDHSMFDNVFVNPEAYASFLETGTWPDKTVLVLENRGAQEKGEVIVKGGRFQGTEVMGLEVHVKDSTHFNREGIGGQWGFYDVGSDGKGKLFEPSASCYTCHAQHAAVDTTFVQFYPTLIELAAKKGTLSDAYRRERDSSQPAAPESKQSPKP
ncbi:cytochrome P460 family protein [Granulicella sibirica]|nr:cytochrome P460 family protein [Granulicella sibirica]